jgi:uncharacterized protein
LYYLPELSRDTPSCHPEKNRFKISSRWYNCLLDEVVAGNGRVANFPPRTFHLYGSVTKMLGTIANTLAIIAGSLVGLLFSRGISGNYREIILSGVGLSVVLIGVKSALVSNDLMVVIFSVILGAVLGEGIRIEKRLEVFGAYLESKVVAKAADSKSFARGFVTASLVFCVGSMAIIGSLESGLTGNHQTLFAKSVLDGVTSIIFSSTMGLGVMFSSLAVLLYQGIITLTAGLMKNLLVPETIAQMTSVGGLLIMAIGFNMLKITTIRVGNLIPAIFLPLAYFALRRWIS